MNETNVPSNHDQHMTKKTWDQLNILRKQNNITLKLTIDFSGSPLLNIGDLLRTDS